MRKMTKRILTLLMAASMMISVIPAFADSVVINSDVCVDGGNHTLVSVAARKPTYTENGWEAYEYCMIEDCVYSTFVAIPALGEPEINSYDEFVMNLNFLEVLANMYIAQKPGNDPLELVIKYIRTGVERYNSGSWGIMAGYENTDFANFVRRTENQMNEEIENVEDYYKITALKNINVVTLPNGDEVDLGHMFGTLDISYTNKSSLNHADVGGWAGDLVDLISSADADEVGGTVEEMVATLKEGYFLKNPQPSDVFSEKDFYGDLDAYYLFNTIMERGYIIDPESEIGPLTAVVMEYFTEDLSVEDRAEYFLKNRLGNVGTREQVRRAVYNTYTGNKVVTTLEGTRVFLTNQENINKLRKASCYVFADYICSLAGDYIEIESNDYFTEFNTEYSSLAPGITHETHYATTADNKQIVYYTATADLSNPNVTVFANYNENDPSKGWKMSRVLDQANAAQARYGNPESPEYIENYQVVAAINADGFNMATGEPGGLLVMNGKEWHPINSSGFFGITKEGKAVIGTSAEYKNIYKDQLRDGVSAFGVTLVKDGKIAVSKTENYYSDRASRTAVGITKTGKVVFMVLDGRQEPRSCGGSMQEIAQVMLEAGCYTAVNLDGGGSTTFVSRPEGETDLMVTSNPSDGYARSVSTSLMMVSTAPSSTKFDHARLDSDYSYATMNTPVQITSVGLSATGNVVDIPEGCTWKVASNGGQATITEDGIFTATAQGSFDIQLLNGDDIIGQTTIHVVTPDNVYFGKKAMDVVKGSKLDVPVRASFEGKDVAINTKDVTLSVVPAGAGTFSGYSFWAKEQTTVKTAAIMAEITNGVSATMSVNLYAQGENTFDFDKATGGDRQFAWDRSVSNALSEDAVTYTALNPDEDMVTSYIFAIDMREIPIPNQLTDLLYMLPGADADGDGMVDGDVSAWQFLLQLAERVSVLTEVKPVLKFDERFDVDFKDIEVLSEYFYLAENGAVINEETNELTLTLKWVDQTKAIDIKDANPLCMLKGVKLTPKAGVWSTTNKINAVQAGEVGYKIYLRANALYSFAQKEENQRIFKLYPFTNTFIAPDGTEQSEAGGYFEDVYKNFEDRYTLSIAKKNGWVNEDGGFAYYVDGVRFTGVKEADGFYYDFGDDGINVGQTKYTGLFENGGKTYYAKLGTLMKSSWEIVGEAMYHCHDDGTAHKTTEKNPITCIKGGVITYTCSKCAEAHKSAFVFPEGHDWDDNHKCYVCGAVGKDITEATIDFGTVENPRGKDTVPSYEQITGGYRPPTFVTFDGKTALTKSNDASLNTDNTMRDLYISWTNDKGVGKAYVNYRGRAGYYGEATLEYILLPASVKNFKADAGVNSITLTWDKSPGAGYYRVYMNGTSSSNKLAEVTGTSYTVTGLDYNKKYTFYIASSAVSTDGENKTYNCSNWATVSTTTKPKPTSADLIGGINISDGVNKAGIVTKNDAKYIMLPAHFNPEALQINFVAGGVAAVNQVTVSGDIGSTTAEASKGKIVFDISKVASKTDNGYKIKLVADSYAGIEFTIMQGENIPSMFIVSDSGAKNRDYVDSVKGNTATGKMILTDAFGEQIFNGALKEIKARGNSTFAYYDKKAYQIKLGSKADLVGSGEEVKTWVLLANYGDATMMHDKFMKDLAKDMGLQYTANSEWVNLWYDGEYRGVYLVSEKNSVGSTSVDIMDMEALYEEINAGYGEDVTAKTGTNAYNQEIKYTEGLTDPADITGGYLIELNHDYIDEVNGFKTRQGVAFNLKSPEWLSREAVKYISEYYQEFEDAVYAVNSNGDYTGYNETTGKYFYDYVDIDSLVKMFIMQEIGLNPDGFKSSLYFNKDSNDIMYVGPIWDQDMTLGTGWSKYIDAGIKDYHYLAEALINIPVFKKKLGEYFKNHATALVEGALADGGVIDSHYKKLSANAQLNYTLWPYVRVGNPTNSNHLWSNATYDLVVDDMKDWLTTRLGVLGERFIPKFDAGDANCDGKVNSDDAVLILKYVVGFTLDNFDVDYADMNGDGKVNSDDAVEILKYVVSH